MTAAVRNHSAPFQSPTAAMTKPMVGMRKRTTSTAPASPVPKREIAHESPLPPWYLDAQRAHDAHDVADAVGSDDDDDDDPDDVR